jgi:site-specific DNA-methyltransferase (adenine-specific)
MVSKKRTRTSSFGTGGRRSHDASAFYAGRLYNDAAASEDGAPYIENPLPASARDQILLGSSSSMGTLPDECIHLMVTSPPYNVGKEYDQDLTLSGYLELLRSVFRETHRVLVQGGRACVNIANLGRKPYIPLHAYVIQVMMGEGFLMRGEIIWDKGSSAGTSTAWGSWRSPANPTLRDVHEYILIFSKGTFKRAALGRPSSVSRDEFLELTKSVWSFPSESARRVGHPAPFPVELPYRLIQLYTYEGDVVLDPFMGSGQTAIAALRSGRHFVGYDIDPQYVKLAQRRIAEFLPGEVPRRQSKTPED